MSLLSRIPSRVRSLLIGKPFGEVFPPRAAPKSLPVDGRTAALRVLRDYVTDLTFYRENREGESKTPLGFQILHRNFHIEDPDENTKLVTPSIRIKPGAATYQSIGLGSYVMESTRNVFAPGTVLQWQSEYNERIMLEIIASKKAERRAILSGLETALTPTEQMAGIRFVMPDYYDVSVCYTLNGRPSGVDDSEATHNRRKVQLEIEMRFTIVALVNTVDFTPTVKVNVDVDQDTNLPIDSTDPTAC